MTWIKVLIFALPWVAWPGREDAFLGPKQAILLIGCWGLLLTTWLSAYPTPIVPWRNVWARRFALYVLLFGAFRFWLPFLDRVPNAGFVYNIHIWEATLYVLTGILTVHCLVTYWLTSSARATQITQWVCQSSVAIAIYVLFQRLGIEQFYAVPVGESDQRWFAGMGNVGIVATYLAMTVPLFLLFTKRRYLVFLGLVLGAIWVSDARYAWGAAGAGLLTYGSLRLSERLSRRWRPTLVLGLIVLFGLGARYAWQPLTTDQRWPIWTEAFRLWKDENPDQSRFSWTGRGLETFPMIFMEPAHKSLKPDIQEIIKGSGWRTAHNDLLQALFELGLLGTGLLVLMVGSSLRAAWDSRQTILGTGWLSAGVSLLFLSATYFPWHVAPTTFLGLLIWAMCERQEATA